MLNEGQDFVFKDEHRLYQARVIRMGFLEEKDKGGRVGWFLDLKALVFQMAKKDREQIVLESGNMQERQIFKDGFSFQKMGIGGLDDQAEAIFRKAFNTRRYPPAVLKKFGIKHVKGMLLYGPPGTGKTLIARKIAMALNCREPKVVNGPEIFDKYVGGSEEKMRDLFKEAEKEMKERGDESDLHIIIFDEIDAICKPRGTHSGGSGV